MNSRRSRDVGRQPHWCGFHIRVARPFARYLNLTVGYVSQLERGVKQPKGPALALLNVIRRKGLGVML